MCYSSTPKTEILATSMEATHVALLSVEYFPTSDFSVNQTGRINLRRRLALAAAYAGFWTLG